MIKPIFVAIASSFLALPAHAAKFQTISSEPLSQQDVFSGRCTHLMTGAIEPGDAHRFEAMLDQLPPQDHDDLNFVICMNSGGGNLTEALKIGEMIHRSFFGTFIDEGSECLSACAVAFMHGRIAYWESFVDFRMLHPGGTLGFHAPSLNLGANADLVPATLVDAAFSAAMQNVSALTDSAARNVQSSARPVIPLGLLSDMLATPSEEMIYADTLHRTFRWQVTVFPVGLSAPEGFDLEVGYMQLCMNIRYELSPQTTQREHSGEIATRQLYDWHQNTQHVSLPSVADGHRIVKMGEVFEQQCSFKYNKERDLFETNYYVEGRFQGTRWLRPVYLFDPNTQLHVLRP